MRFQYLCDLFEQLEQLELRDLPLPTRQKARRYNEIIQQWFHYHHGLVNDYGTILSCIFPEKRVDRVYSMQRLRFTAAIADCLGLGEHRSRRLRQAPENEDISLILQAMVDEHGGGVGSRSLDLTELDHCFANLAAISRWSSPRARNEVPLSAPRSQREILRPVVTRMQGRDMKWFVRILFKKLGPLQVNFNTTLRAAHPLLPAMVKVRETFADALELANSAELRTCLEDHGNDYSGLPPALIRANLKPRLGCKVGRPHFIKARSFQSWAELVGRRRWALEPKYDGEYCQLHVDLSKGRDCIQIFSKSGKDSTRDRQAVHAWLKQILQVGKDDCRFKRGCILEGEIVVLDVRTNRILDFDKIRKHVSRSGSFLGVQQDSAPHEHEQLRVIFYDALMIDDDVLIHHSYQTRRNRLRKLLPSEHGWACRGTWGAIDFGRPEFQNVRARQKILQHHFRKAKAQRLEGMVLKPLDGSYLRVLPTDASNYDGTVIKMKADYIPGMGDTADFAVVGAYSSSRHQVEHDLLKQVKWTHFELACLVNKNEVQDYGDRPLFRLMGAVSRPAVSADDMRFLSRHGDFRRMPNESGTSEHATYDIQCVEGHREPKTLFKRPFIVDVLGSGFERPGNAGHCMLRHPRITKIHNDDRGIEDIVSFGELQRLAKETREIPEDVLKEEQKIMLQMKEACKPKRSRYIEQPSPPRPTASSSTPATGSMQSARTPSVPLVRMDSCEMQPGDERFVSPLAGKDDTKAAQSTWLALSENNENRKRDSEQTNDDPPQKKRSVDHPGRKKHGQGCAPTSAHTRSDKQVQSHRPRPVHAVGSLAQLRERAARRTTANAAKLMAAKRSIAPSDVETMHPSKRTSRIQTELSKIVSPANKQSNGQRKPTPLAEPRSLMSLNKRSLQRSKSDDCIHYHACNAVSPPKKRRVEHAKSFAYGQTNMAAHTPLQTPVSTNQPALRDNKQTATSFCKGQIVDISLLQFQPHFRASSTISKIMQTPPAASPEPDKGTESLQQESPDSEDWGPQLPLIDFEDPTPRHTMPKLAKYWTERKGPEQLDDGSPIKDCTIYLSPAANFEHVTKRLIPLFGARVTDSLSHWQRDRRPLAEKLGLVVEESQNDYGAQKLVLLDSASGQCNNDFILEVMKTRLGQGELIDVWDWRALEDMAHLDTLAGSGQLTREVAREMAARIEGSFVGTIRMTSLTAMAAIKADGLSAAMKRVTDLDYAAAWQWAEVYESGEELVNIFDMPANSRLVAAYFFWSAELRHKAFG